MSSHNRLKNEYSQIGSSIYYALRFSNKNMQDKLIPFIAFFKEIRKTTIHYRESDIAKTKLSWWQEEILKMYQERPAHPITTSLLPIIKSCKIPQQLFMEYLDGALLKINTDHFCTDKDIEFFSYREYALPIIIMSYVLYETPVDIMKSVNQLSYALTIIDMITHAKLYQDKNKQIFSLEMQNKIANNKDLFKHYANQAKAADEKGLNLLDKAQKKQLHPLLTFLKLKMALLKEIEKDDFNVLQYEYHLTPFRKCWIAWRA